MRLYEVGEEVREGFAVHLDPVPRVLTGVAKEEGDVLRRLCLPLGRSIRRYIVGDELDEGLRLMKADLKKTSSGLVLVRAPNRPDPRALVLVLTAPEPVSQVIYRYLPGGRPALVASLPVCVDDTEWNELLFLFKKGDGLRVIRHGSAELDVTLRWDGQMLSCPGPQRLQSRQTTQPQQMSA